jgi:signal transduction histidine kinase
MSPSLIPGPAQVTDDRLPPVHTAARSPLAQLLHALNQPLTGLQCSMEVALASSRTPEHYARVLREGLDLTERMRLLVEAIREVTDFDEERNREEAGETIELSSVLRETLDDLAPVAEMKSVRLALESGSADSALLVRLRRRTLATAVFHLLESALSLAARGTTLSIETGASASGAWFRVRWQAGRALAGGSRSELGLLVAQAGLERAGAGWERERTDNLETVMVRMQTAEDKPRHS